MASFVLAIVDYPGGRCAFDLNCTLSHAWHLQALRESSDLKIIRVRDVIFAAGTQKESEKLKMCV